MNWIFQMIWLYLTSQGWRVTISMPPDDYVTSTILFAAVLSGL